MKEDQTFNESFLKVYSQATHASLEKTYKTEDLQLNNLMESIWQAKAKTEEDSN